jgi:hypothetical protein
VAVAAVAAVMAAVAGASLLQISPIRIDPWTWLGKRLGRALNGEVLDKLEKLENRMDKMERQGEQDKMASARIRILRFGDECTRGLSHSEEHFNQVLDDITAYERYCNAHPEYKNAKAVLTIARIKEIYTARLENGDFL